MFPVHYDPNSYNTYYTCKLECKYCKYPCSINMNLNMTDNEYQSIIKNYICKKCNSNLKLNETIQIKNNIDKLRDSFGKFNSRIQSIEDKIKNKSKNDMKKVKFQQRIETFEKIYIFLYFKKMLKECVQYKNLLNFNKKVNNKIKKKSDYFLNQLLTQNSLISSVVNKSQLLEDNNKLFQENVEQRISDNVIKYQKIIDKLNNDISSCTIRSKDIREAKRLREKLEQKKYNIDLIDNELNKYIGEVVIIKLILIINFIMMFFLIIKLFI